MPAVQRHPLGAEQVDEVRVLGFVVEWRGTGVWLGLASGLAFVAVVLVARFAMRERLGLLKPFASR